MALPPGTRFGPYEIVAPLGAGGMGEVYRARDTKLNREVALKVLPQGVTADPERLARFRREAQVLASLNHPHIAHVHGLEDAGDTQAIVMELVEGEDLAQRLSRGAIVVDEAIPIALQIAEALEAAHEQGIIHRDLKPANIKVREDGTVKVLDFGLAKALDPGTSGSQDPANSPTLTARATQMGMILGTAAYMAPEQARGKSVDRRADVWAFGVVLYEMLTGRRLFARDEVSDSLAAVLTAEPDLGQLPDGTPLPIRRLLARCLVKDRKQRLDSMAAARLELEEARNPQPTEAVSRAATPRRGVLGAAALVAVGVVLGAATIAVWPRASGGSVNAPASLVAQVAAPPDTLLAFFDGFALSPDGATLVFAARSNSGVRQLWLRPLDAATATPLAGTDNGAYPFWSPDGRSVAFFADFKLKRVNLDGGGLQTICDVPASLFISGTWGSRGDILWGTYASSVATGQRQRIFRVSAGGGIPEALDALGAAAKPFWLPDGRHFLYAQVEEGGEGRGIMMADTAGSPPRTVLPMDGNINRALYAYGGGVLFVNRNESLVAQRIDTASGELLGEPVVIALDAGTPKGWLAVASDGRRVVALVRSSPGSPDNPGAPVGRLTWVDRQGRATGTLGDAAGYWTLRLSPDGATAVVNLNSDLWTIGTDGRRARLTDRGMSFNAVWSPSSQEVIFSQVEQDRDGPVRRGLAPGAPTKALPGVTGGPSDWSRSGRLLTSDGDIHVYNLADGTSTPWLATRAQERQPRVSSDGRWVAYSSNATGRFEVYVRAFEGTAPPITVSTDGGDHPVWRQDGRELFFLSPGNDLISSSVTISGDLMTVGQPEKLFTIPLNDVTREVYSPYDVAPDGQRFLMNLPDRPTPLFLLQGLDTLMARR